MTSLQKPSQSFQRLLTFFTPRSSSKIRFTDSLKGDLSLGLNFPIALLLATVRHLVFATEHQFSAFSPRRWDIAVPAVQTSRLLLGGPGALDGTIRDEKRYSLSELWSAVGAGAGAGAGAPSGSMSLWQTLEARMDAIGLWALAAERDGCVSGLEVKMFQRGEIMERIAERRKGVDNVLPFWRGGPLW